MGKEGERHTGQGGLMAFCGFLLGLFLAAALAKLDQREPRRPPSMGNRRLFTPLRLSLAAAVLLFMGAFSTHSLQPGVDDPLPDFVNASFGLGFYVFGFVFVITALVGAAVRKDGRAALVALLAVVLGGAMAGVVQQEPESFWSVSAGVFVSLILALAATSIDARRS